MGKRLVDQRIVKNLQSRIHSACEGSESFTSKKHKQGLHGKRLIEKCKSRVTITGKGGHHTKKSSPKTYFL